MAHGDAYRVVKIGGSLLTDKRILRTPNFAAIEAYGRTMAELAESRAPLIFVAGGGSFGNAQAHPEFDLAGEGVRTLLGEWLIILQEGLRAAGARVDLLLARDLWSGGCEGRGFDAAPVVRILRRRRLPVLLGDELHTRTRARIMSSDLLPIFLASRLSLRRVVMLTNVKGLISGGAVLDTFDSRRIGKIAEAGPSGAPDVTGGMGRKVQVLRHLARAGVEGVICHGASGASLGAALFSDRPPGTFFPAPGAARAALQTC